MSKLKIVSFEALNSVGEFATARESSDTAEVIAKEMYCRKGNQS